ncbi:MAG TPA: CdaR family protein, partial [Methylomirabilota bacterium]|nr:CdaR family protein [Methylomirabilota bacterium]
MSRIGRLLFHNWPLKLAAIALASMLYAGLVISQSAQELPGGIRVDILNLPANSSLVQTPPQVTRIRYVAISDPTARATPDSFRATIDLKDVDPAAGPTVVPIRVESVDPRFTALSWDPPSVQIRLDPLRDKVVKVNVVTGPIPAKLQVRPAVVTPATVTVRGPASVIDRVASARADVTIEPSGLNVDRDVDLVPVDDVGNRVTPVNVDPPTVHVQIAVLSEPQTHTVPVNPNVTGTQAAGYEVVSVAVDPAVVTLQLDANQVAAVPAADTAPISISGATQDVEADVGLALPLGVVGLEGTTVHVTVTIRPIASTRTFDAGIVPSGARTDLLYSLSVNHA